MVPRRASGHAESHEALRSWIVRCQPLGCLVRPQAAATDYQQKSNIGLRRFNTPVLPGQSKIWQIRSSKSLDFCYLSAQTWIISAASVDIENEPGRLCDCAQTHKRAASTALGRARG
jgi:hypothetical protein